MLHMDFYNCKSDIYIYTQHIIYTCQSIGFFSCLGTGYAYRTNSISSSPAVSHQAWACENGHDAIVELMMRRFPEKIAEVAPTPGSASLGAQLST